jgi:hypothetical protein
VLAILDSRRRLGQELRKRFLQRPGAPVHAVELEEIESVEDHLVVIGAAVELVEDREADAIAPHRRRAPQKLAPSPPPPCGSAHSGTQFGRLAAHLKMITGEMLPVQVRARLDFIRDFNMKSWLYEAQTPAQRECKAALRVVSGRAPQRLWQLDTEELEPKKNWEAKRKKARRQKQARKAMTTRAIFWLEGSLRQPPAIPTSPSWTVS